MARPTAGVYPNFRLLAESSDFLAWLLGITVSYRPVTTPHPRTRAGLPRGKIMTFVALHVIYGNNELS